ncbi:MAG: SagB/ThcOx family dehydrogenase [Verrucomicrobiota bacterium]
MRTNSPGVLPITALVMTLGLSALPGEGLKPIPLPAPQTEGGKPLMEALKQRRTTREFKPGKLPPQVLANLLWAGFGINRPADGRRTAPSAMNAQEVGLYVALPEGLYLYDAKANELTPVSGEDLRTKTNGQPFIKDAPAVLVFVADLSRLAKAKAELRPLYAQFATGCISQNISLYCASAGLATVVYDLERAPLAAAMKLKPEQRIILAQAVGYPGAGAGGKAQK